MTRTSVFADGVPNPVTGLGSMLTHPFMLHALLSGTAVAVLSGLVGYFVVLRGQVFAGDALGHVAYTGALAALAAGVDLRLGLFAATITVGLALGALGGRGAADDVTIGTTFSWILGLGVFFLAYYTTHGSTSNATANVTVLFGSIFGISASAATTAALSAAGLIVVLLTIGRPLLFASLDPAAAEASQVVGTLLLFGLLAAPAATAQRLTTQPWHALWLSPILAVISMWAGLTIAYTAPTLPPSFTIIAVATALYTATLLIGHRRAIVRAG